MSTEGSNVGYAPDEFGRPPATLTRLRSRVRSTAAELVQPRLGVAPLEPGWAGPVIGLWAIGRAVNLAFLSVAFLASTTGGWTFGPDSRHAESFVNFLSGWDAERYGTIAMHGYPTTLPLDIHGAVQRNDWAFLPVFPFLERVLAQATGMPWQLAGVLISVGASAAATLVLYALLRHITSARASWWAVVLFSFGPLSFVFVLGYAESLFLLLIFAALLLAVRRRYAYIAPIGVVAAFTRPGAVALALALGIILVGRWMLRTRDPLSRSEVAGLVTSGLLTASAGLMWPVIADAATGQSGAYVHTEMAWWVPYLGHRDFIALAPSLVMGWTWLGAVGVAVVMGVVAMTFRWILSRPVRGLGLEVIAFALSYTLYLFVVFLPTQSLPRLVLPLSPLLADSRLSQSPRRRHWSVAASVAMQAAAIYLLWTLGNP